MVVWNIWAASGFGKTAQGRGVDDQRKFGEYFSVQIGITKRSFPTDDPHICFHSIQNMRYGFRCASRSEDECGFQLFPGNILQRRGDAMDIGIVSLPAMGLSLQYIHGADGLCFAGEFAAIGENSFLVGDGYIESVNFRIGQQLRQFLNICQFKCLIIVGMIDSQLFEALSKDFRGMRLAKGLADEPVAFHRFRHPSADRGAPALL